MNTAYDDRLTDVERIVADHVISTVSAHADIHACMVTRYATNLVYVYFTCSRRNRQGINRALSRHANINNDGGTTCTTLLSVSIVVSLYYAEMIGG